MQELVTINNVFNALMLVVGWSIRSELHHIRTSIAEAKEVAGKAHGRIDEIILNLK